MEYVLAGIIAVVSAALGGALALAWHASRRAASAEDRAAKEDSDADAAKESLQGEVARHMDTRQLLKDARDEIERSQAVIRSQNDEKSRLERELAEVKRQRDDLLTAVATRDPAVLGDATRAVLRRLEEMRRAQGGGKGGAGTGADGGGTPPVHG